MQSNLKGNYASWKLLCCFGSLYSSTERPLDFLRDPSIQVKSGKRYTVCLFFCLYKRFITLQKVKRENIRKSKDTEIQGVPRDGGNDAGSATVSSLRASLSLSFPRAPPSCSPV